MHTFSDGYGSPNARGDYENAGDVENYVGAWSVDELIDSFDPGDGEDGNPATPVARLGYALRMFELAESDASRQIRKLEAKKDRGDLDEDDEEQLRALKSHVKVIAREIVKIEKIRDALPKEDR